MGWETTLYTRLSFHKETYNRKSEVEDALKEERDRIERCKSGLKKLAYMTEPKKFCDADEDPEYYVDSRLEEYLEELDEATIAEYKLQILLDRWDECHNEEGLAKEYPHDYDDSFLDGDFVYTDKHPTQHSLFGYEVDKDGNIVDDKDAIIDENGHFKPIPPIELPKKEEDK